MQKLLKKFRTFKHVMSESGVKGVLFTGVDKLHRMLMPKTPHQKARLEILSKAHDVIAVDWKDNPRKFVVPGHDGPYRINWILHPGGASSGGSQNIFRFIKYLEQAGHTNTIYFYSVNDFTLDEVRKNTQRNYTSLNAEFRYHDGPMDDCDAIFATGWETAYPAYNDPSDVQRFYFVQDFEPYFSPVGSESVLAENTYRFNFHGITAGKWLSAKLSQDFGMSCDSYDFGVDTTNYEFTNTGQRKKVFFYARPVTKRRGFEMGALALKEFHRIRPDVEIVLAGWDASNYELDFPYTNLSIMSISELSEVYNECAAALVLSFSNMSLLPLELLACGVIPVLNEGDNNSMVASNDFIKYCAPTPHSLARGLNDIISQSDLPDYAKKASESVRGHSWDLSGDTFVKAFERVMHG